MFTCEHCLWTKLLGLNTWHKCKVCKVIGQPFGPLSVMIPAGCTWCANPATHLNGVYAACATHTNADLLALPDPAIEEYTE